MSFRPSVVTTSTVLFTFATAGIGMGSPPQDRRTQTRVAAVFPELKLVKLEQAPWYFDLEKKRLIDASRYVVVV